MKIALKILCVLLLWSVVVSVVLYVEPESVKDVGAEGMYLPFFVPFSLALWYTLFVITAHWWASYVLTALGLLAIILTMIGIMNIFLGFVMVACAAFVLYITKRH